MGRGGLESHEHKVCMREGQALTLVDRTVKAATACGRGLQGRVGGGVNRRRLPPPGAGQSRDTLHPLALLLY